MVLSDFHFEIDAQREKAGWLPCRVIFAGQSLPLSASAIFPPFRDMLNFIKAIAVQRLPHIFFLDEEGIGAYFEAWPLSQNSPNFRLKIRYYGPDDEQIWMDAELDRLTVVQEFFDAMWLFANVSPNAEKEWQLSKASLLDFEEFQKKGMASRSDTHIAQDVSFHFFGFSPTNTMAGHWLNVYVGDLLEDTWSLTDMDPFWWQWIDFLEKVALGQNKESFIWPNYQIVLNQEYSKRNGNKSLWEDGIMNSRTFYAEPTDYPNHFRWRVTKTDLDYEDLLVIDEVFDRQVFVRNFLQEFSAMLVKDYQCHPNTLGEKFDLRKLSVDELLKTLEK